MNAFNSTNAVNNRMNTLSEMERQYENSNEKYFVQLLNHQDIVIRTRAVCILADIATELAVEEISKVLRTDVEPLVRHEASFLPGTTGFYKCN